MGDIMARLPWVDEEALAKAHPRLFHYTREAVLPLILSSGGLLATHYSKTNDRREFTSLRQPLAEAMFQQVLPLVREKMRTRALNFGGDEAKMLEIARGDAERSFDILVSAAPTPPHITCFSSHDLEHQVENGLLTMWRLYGGEGGGIALGFNTAALVKETEKLQEEWTIAAIYLDRVGYGTDDPQTAERMKAVPELALIYERAFKMLFNDLPALTDSQADDLLRFFVLAASNKHPDFIDEREIRLVTAVSIEPAHNGRKPLVSPAEGRLLIPCLAALEEVMVGPSDQQDALAEAARQALDAAGFQSIPVRRSATPYRRLG